MSLPKTMPQSLHRVEPSLLSDSVLDQIFRSARSFSQWKDKPVPESLIYELYDLLKYGPTSANCSPARFIFLQSKESKESLKPYLAQGNVEQTMSAPLTVIIAHDLKFYDHLPTLFPFVDARSWFVGNETLIQDTAFRNASLQAAYLIIAARALGLDSGAMSGFDSEGVKHEFFADCADTMAITLLCNLGYGKVESLHPRAPRFDFEQVCQIL